MGVMAIPVTLPAMSSHPMCGPLGCGTVGVLAYILFMMDVRRAVASTWPSVMSAAMQCMGDRLVRLKTRGLEQEHNEGTTGVTA